MTIRPFDFSPADYETRIAIGNAAYPDYQETVDELRFEDTSTDPKVQWKRFFAEVDGVPVGVASYSQDIAFYHPQKFNLTVFLMPQWQGQGIGKALYEHLLDTLAPLNPLVVRATAREDYPRAMRFLTDRGFVEVMREWESRFNPQTFDPTPFTPSLQRVEQSGIVIRSVAELQKSDPLWAKKLHGLDSVIQQDIPASDTLTEPGFAYFERTTLNDPDFFPEAWFIALDGDSWVGESSLELSQGEPGIVYVGATGVLKDYRRRGIATALELAAAAWAKQAGIHQLRTWNAQENEAMLAINVAMGFERIPAWVEFEKKLK